MAGEHEEVDTEFGDVDRQMRNRLRPVDQHPRPVAVTQLDDLLDRRHRAQRVRHLGYRHQLGLRTQQILELRQQQVARFVNRCDPQTAPGFCESSCHGTILAWCSRWVMTISSPGPKCLPPHA